MNQGTGSKKPIRNFLKKKKGGRKEGRKEGSWSLHVEGTACVKAQRYDLAENVEMGLDNVMQRGCIEEKRKMVRGVPVLAHQVRT